MLRSGCLILLARHKYTITKALVCFRFRSLPFEWNNGLTFYNKNVMIRFADGLHINIMYEKDFIVYGTYNKELKILIMYKRYRIMIRIDENRSVIRPFDVVVHLTPILHKYQFTTIGKLYMFINEVARKMISVI